VTRFYSKLHHHHSRGEILEPNTLTPGVTMSKGGGMKTTKKIGLVACSAIVAGNMMGSGIALLPANLAAIGSITIISWAIAILGAISLAYVFAKLGMEDPQEGGPIAYSGEVSPILGYQAGTLYFHANWIGNLAIAVAGVAYLSYYFPSLKDPVIAGIVSVAIIWIFVGINLIGPHIVGKLTSIGVILLLIPVIATGTAGFYFFKPDIFAANWNVSHQGDFQAVFAGVLLCLWSFIGVESASTDSNLVRDPKKTIPLATMVGSIIAALVYVAASTAIIGMFDAATVAKSGAPFSLSVEKILGPWSGHIVTALVAFGCLTSLGSWMMLVAQAGARNAHDGILPKVFGKINKRNVPVKGMVLIALMMTILMAIVTAFSHNKGIQHLFQNIISIAVLLTIFPYFYSVLNLIHRNNMKPKKRFIQGIAALLSVIFCLMAIAGAEDPILVAAITFALITLIFYERKRDIPFNGANS